MVEMVDQAALVDPAALVDLVDWVAAEAEAVVDTTPLVKV